MSWGSFFYPHTVSIRDKRPPSGMGGGYAAARSVSAEVKDEQQLVRAADGAEVVSSTQVTIPWPDTVPPGSLVTVWAGTAMEREATVLRVAVNPNAPPLDAHIVLYLT